VFLFLVAHQLVLPFAAPETQADPAKASITDPLVSMPVTCFGMQNSINRMLETY
jgi:hypothetical protein